MKKVLLLLANGFEALEASVFTDVFGFANTGGADIELISAGLHQKLDCAYGYSVIPHKLLDELDLNDFDALAIPGGPRDYGFYDDAYSKEFLETIKFFNDKNKPIAGICAAALPIAKAGALQGKKATTYFGKRRQDLINMGIEVLDERIVRDQNIITSSSPSTALDVAFLLLEVMTSKEVVELIRKAFGFDQK